MKRVHNFGAGPATLPVAVLEEASRGVLEIGGSGMSILEVSHRSKVYEAIHFDARDRLLKAMGLDATEYAALFLGGGASQQFAMLPMNPRLRNTARSSRNRGVISRSMVGSGRERPTRYVDDADVAIPAMASANPPSGPNATTAKSVISGRGNITTAATG